MPESTPFRVLLAVNDPIAGSTLRAYLRARGDCAELVMPPFEESPSAIHALLSTLAAERPSLAVLEVNERLEMLTAVLQDFPGLPVLVAVAHPGLAFRAAKLGAADVLSLPLERDQTAFRLNRLIAALQAHLGAEAQSHPGLARDFPTLFSSSPRMMEIRETIDKVATTSATVLVRGESGVGKEVVARMIFARSERCRQPFIKVNCAAIPYDLLESELFGFEAGAFTGALRAKPGKFELADGGTIFLDEIAEMHPLLQAKLLHVLQDGEFARLGAKRDTAVDVRVVCATNKSLEQRVAEGLFREDLLYRINVVTVHIPPLRERRDEIPVLIRYFTEKYSQLYRRSVPPLDDEVMGFLLSYSWPGNIRELENLCKRYVIVGGATQIVRELQARTGNGRPSAEPPPAPAEPVDEETPSLLEIGRRAAWQAERQAIQEMLTQTRWNRKEAARRLRVSYKALLNKIQQIEADSETTLGDSKAS